MSEKIDFERLLQESQLDKSEIPNEILTMANEITHEYTTENWPSSKVVPLSKDFSLYLWGEAPDGILCLFAEILDKRKRGKWFSLYSYTEKENK